MPDVEAANPEIRGEHFEIVRDVWFQRVAAWLPDGLFTVSECLTEALGIPVAQQQHHHRLRTGQMLRQLGCKRRKAGRNEFPDGSRPRLWCKSPTSEQATFSKILSATHGYHTALVWEEISDEQIREWFLHVRSNLVRAYLLGGAFYHGKQIRKHGQYQPWLETLEVPARTARMYVNVHHVLQQRLDLGEPIPLAALHGSLADILKIFKSSTCPSYELKTNTWDSFVAIWAAEHGTKPVTTKQIWRLAVDGGHIPNILGVRSDRSQQSRLGKALRKEVGCLHGTWRIESAEPADKGNPRHRLVRAHQPDSGENDANATRFFKSGEGLEQTSAPRRRSTSTLSKQLQEHCRNNPSEVPFVPKEDLLTFLGVPYGWKISEDGRGLSRDITAQETKAQINQLHEIGCSALAICRVLNIDGPDYRGSSWTPERVVNITKGG